MVLVLALERKDPQKKDAGKGTSTYRFLQFSKSVAVVYNSNEEKPSEEEVENALLSVTAEGLGDSPSFLVTPYDMFIDNSTHDAPKVTVEKLRAQIGHSVNRRENTTIINRGVENEEHLEPVLLTILDAVKSSAESAMQMVADEIAKEKQMQRLLQLETDDGEDLTNTAVKSVTSPEGKASPNPGAVSEKAPISKGLRKQLQQLQKAFPYAADRKQRATSPAATVGTSGKLDQRYTLLSSTQVASDLLAPCTSGNTLVPTSFTVNPPVHRRFRGSAVSVVRERTSRSHSYQFAQQKRRSTMGLLAELKDDSAMGEEEAPLKGNGWGEDISFFQFDGDSSVMALPGVPHFEDLVKCFSVDFWLRTDCRAAEGKRLILQIAEGQRDDVGQLFQVGLNWYEEMEETLRVFFRDSTNRVLEALIPVKECGIVSSGKEFHHVMLHFRSLEEGTIECLVNGTTVSVQLLQQEHPIAFNPWPHRLFIGGCPDDNNSASMVLRGSILELRFWTGGESPKPIVYWPLLADAAGTLCEVTRTVPADHHETLLHLQQLREKAPHSAPFFDGSLVMNAGTLPLWGELMHNWRLEVRFRTDVSTRIMSLVGVTDQKFKMQEVGLVLNAEPVFSKERLRFHEFNVTFYIVDAFGACCSALLRGTERHNLMDGEWHTLVWKCVDSETNKFTVKVDGTRQELLYVAREGPSRFVEMDDWVCVGGHNVRNWKVKRSFEGYVSRFFVSVRGHPYATLLMSEGPGSYVLLDSTGHRNHGLLVNPSTNAVRRNDVCWAPAQDEVAEEDEEDGQGHDVIVYKNNNVAIAAVVFTCAFDTTGIPREVIYDTFNQTYSVPEEVPHAFEERSALWGTWQALSAECFKPLETVNQLEESVNMILQSRGDTPRGHLMVIIRVGDCHATLLHLSEPDLPQEALFNTNMLKWQYPFTVEGSRGRRELMLNRMIESLEGVLLNDTMMPFITARLGPLNVLPGGNSLLCEDMVNTLHASGSPWFLAAVVHTLLLHTEYGSNLHIIHRLHPTMTLDEGASLCLFNQRLCESSRNKAAVVIQRNWKIVMAKAEAARREEVRQFRDLKVEEIRVFRMNPTIQMRQELYALLVTLHDSACEKLPPLRDESSAELEELLRKQGYNVDRLTNPSAGALTKALSQVDADKSNFIYISGYGGQMNIRQPPLFSLQALSVSLEEGATRAAVELDAGREFRALIAQCAAEGREIKPSGKKRKAGGKKAAGQAVKKLSAEEQEMEARQLQSMIRAAQLDVEQEEAFVRDSWNQEYDSTSLAITREIRQAVVATREYEKTYKSGNASSDGSTASATVEHKSVAPRLRNYVYPCESRVLEPFANQVIDVEDLVRNALQQRTSPTGLQTVVAIDLEPVTALSKGYACLASSTGNTLRIPYQPQQRRVLSLALNKAFAGGFPKVPATSKYAVLSGSIETTDSQRDWKSFAWYMVSEMCSACPAEQVRGLYEELDREISFTAELVPVREIALSAEAKDRRQRDREAQKGTAVLSFGVGSTKVQNDMFSVFKTILEGLPLSEISFTNTLNVVFTQSNQGIDGILLAELRAEIEKCRPTGCVMCFECSYSGSGAVIKFDPLAPNDKLFLTQWFNILVVRSLSWQIGRNPMEGYRKLDVDFVEYVYTVKTTCDLRHYELLLEQWCCNPIAEKLIRILKVEMAKTK